MTPDYPREHFESCHEEWIDKMEREIEDKNKTTPQSDFVKGKISFYAWMIELHRIAMVETGSPQKINESSVKEWFDDGFTPFQVFRETFDMENDAE